MFLCPLKKWNTNDAWSPGIVLSCLSAKLKVTLYSSGIQNPHIAYGVQWYLYILYYFQVPWGISVLKSREKQDFCVRPSVRGREKTFSNFFVSLLFLLLRQKPSCLSAKDHNSPFCKIIWVFLIRRRSKTTRTDIGCTDHGLSMI